MYLDEKMYFMNELEKRKNSVYIMYNKELAEELFEEVKQWYSDAKMVITDSAQYIMITKKAEKKMINMIQKRRDKLKREYEKVEKELMLINATVRDGDWRVIKC